MIIIKVCFYPTTPNTPLFSTMKCLSAAKVDSIIQLLKSGILAIISLPTLVSLLVSSPRFTGNTVLTSPSPLVVALPRFPPPISIISCISWEEGRLRMQPKAPRCSKKFLIILNQPLASKTVRRHLKKAGMKAIVKKKKPLLSARHRKARRGFAEAHLEWTVEDWKCVVWSDETKINCLGSDGRRWVYKKAGEPLNDRLVEGTLKFGGGSVMVWGCMLWEGP